MIKVAISGKMGAGKDTMGDILKEMYAAKRLKCADLLYQVAYMIGMPTDPTKKDRELLLYLGQKGRSYNPNIFIDDVVNRQVTIAQDEGYDLAYLTDLRFANEYEVLKKNGFIMVRIEAKEELRRERANCWMELCDMSEKDRLTETELDNHDFDIVIENNGSINSFYNEIHRLFEKRYCLT